MEVMNKLNKFTPKHWMKVLIIIICIFIFILMEIKFFNGKFNPWGNLRLIIIAFIGILISRKI